ncbi:MAG: sugar phosphate isomerase/epimerase [Planctomycetota bacterium]|nr:sugar phosphate isomerase/epimerase [Planctomycetota bacterium]
MPSHVLGAQLFSCRQFCQTLPDIAQTLQKVRAIGYTAVQISGFGPVAPKDVARLVADSGLSVAGTHMGWASFLTDLDAVIETHRLWNCSHAAIGALPEEYRTAAGLERFLRELPPVAEKLLASGIDFSYHNHAHEFARIEASRNTTWLAELYARTDGRLLKAELDTYWIAAGGADPAAWIRRLAGRQPLLHLKDMAILPGHGQRFAPIGEGNLNWPAILSAAADSGVQWCLVEQDDCYGESCFDVLETSYRNLRAMGLS